MSGKGKRTMASIYDTGWWVKMVRDKKKIKQLKNKLGKYDSPKVLKRIEFIKKKKTI